MYRKWGQALAGIVLLAANVNVLEKILSSQKSIDIKTEIRDDFASGE